MLSQSLSAGKITSWTGLATSRLQKLFKSSTDAIHTLNDLIALDEKQFEILFDSLFESTYTIETNPRAVSMLKALLSIMPLHFPDAPTTVRSEAVQLKFQNVTVAAF